VTVKAEGRQVSTVPERRRKELVLAAFHLLAEHGFEGLRTRDVAAEVGVNIATLHYYFPTKEALIRGVLEHAMDRFRSTLTPHGSPSDQLRNYLRAAPALLKDEPDLRIVMGELALRSARDESIAAIMSQMYTAWHAAVRGLLRKAVKAGHLKPETDTDAVAASVVATLTAMTMPTMAATAKGDQIMRQLERWLGISDRPRINQATD
jgi:AcrR family transcriptional regulator